MTKLKHVLRLQYGSALAAEYRQEGGVPVFGSNGQVGTHTQGNMHSPSVVVGRKGSHGKVVWADHGGFCIDTALFVDDRFTTSHLRYAFYLLQSLKLDEPSKDSAVPGLDRFEAHNKLVPTHSLLDQKAIADFLDHEIARIDKLVEKKQRLVSVLDEQRRVVAIQCLSRGMTEFFWNSATDAFSFMFDQDDWRERTVKNMVKFMTSGSRGWSDLLGTEGEGFIQSGDIGRRMDVSLNFAQRVQPQRGAEAERTLVRSGDVLICITGGRTGAVGYVRNLHERAYINQHVCLLRANSELILPELLAHILWSEIGRKQIELCQYGVKQGLGFGEVAGLKLPVPPLDQQSWILREINRKVHANDAVAERIGLSIERLRELRSSLITAAVTGQIDVVTWGRRGMTDRRFEVIEAELGSEREDAVV